MSVVVDHSTVDKTALVDAFASTFIDLLRHAPPTSHPVVETERREMDALLSKRSGDLSFSIPTDAPVCRFVDQLTAGADASSEHRSLLNVCQALSEHAEWRNKYKSSAEYAHLFQNFSFCDFIGPDGWQATRDVTLGLVLLGPHTFYPFHHHPARELYYIVSGTAEWAVDFEPPRRFAPGSWLVHSENQPHAMQTGDAPMLAVSAWRGDILSRSAFSAAKNGQMPKKMPQPN